jgi:hypothetical protein
VAINVHATRFTKTDVAISKLRAVGDYTSGNQHEDTLAFHHKWGISKVLKKLLSTVKLS